MIELRWTPLHESGSIKTRSLVRFIYDTKLEFFWSFSLLTSTAVPACFYPDSMFNCFVCRLLTESKHSAQYVTKRNAVLSVAALCIYK